MKKITVYELLGLIKDNKAPKKIIYDGIIYTLSFNRYYSSEKMNYLFDLFNRNFMDTDIPNLTVEIIEENDEWEDIEEIDDIEFTCLEDGLNLLKKWTNSLIKNQKYLKEKVDENG